MAAFESMRTIPDTWRLAKALLKRWGSFRIKRWVWNSEFDSGAWRTLRAPMSLVNVLNHFLKPETFILDLGCGDGTLLAALRGAGWHGWYTGVDLSDAAIQQARERHSGNCEWIVCDIERFAPRRKYDFILFIESLYYVPARRVDPMLRRFEAFLTDGGKIIVRVWNPSRHSAHVEAVQRRYPTTHTKSPGSVIWVLEPQNNHLLNL